MVDREREGENANFLLKKIRRLKSQSFLVFGLAATCKILAP